MTWYATREDVKSALDFKQTARADKAVDRALAAASRSVDGLCHRTFYPEQTTHAFDWPNGQYARPWRLWLDARDLIAVDEVVSGGTVIDPAAILLEPNQYGPPYNQIQVDIATTSGWIGSSTHQRNIVITGLWGYRNDETLLGAANALDATSTTLTVDAETSAEVGVGSLLRLDDERLTVTGRRQLDTGQTLAGDLDAQAKTVMIQVQDGTGFAVDETILIDSERMLIVDIAGNALTVKRAWDGSVIATHTASAPVYAPRRLTVQRGVLGTTAASHAAGTTVRRWDAPPLVHQLTLGEAINIVLQEQAGWFRTASGGTSASREASLDALKRLQEQTYIDHGRKARLRGV